MTYSIFISHAHQYHDALYNSLATRLDQQRFDWIDVSVPHRRRFRADAPLADTELQELLRGEISRADVVIAIAKPVASRRHWLKWELTTARSLGKPIIAVWRRHVDFNVSRFVIEMAQDLCVDTWRIDDITNAVKIAVSRAREEGATSRSTADAVPALDQFSDDDVEVAAIAGLEGDPVTVTEELAVATGEAIQLPVKSPKDVLPLPAPADAGVLLPIPVQQALRELAGRRESMAAEAPKDVIGRPVGSAPGQRINGMRWRWSATID